MDIQLRVVAFGICLFTPEKNSTACSGFSPGLTDRTGDASLRWVHRCGPGASSSFTIAEACLTSSLHLGFQCRPKRVYAVLSSENITVLHRAKGVT